MLTSAKILQALMQGRFGPKITGRRPIYQPLYASKWYANAGFAKGSTVNLFGVGLSQTDNDDPRATKVAFTEEETNIKTPGQLDYDFVGLGLRTRLHLLPKERQVSGIETDADAIFTVLQECQDDLLDIMRRGNLRILLNGVVWQEIPTPFINCPPGSGVVIDQWAAKNDADATAADRDACWVTQSPKAKVYEFPDPLVIPKGTNYSFELEFPEAASPSLDNTVTGSLDPYVYMRTWVDGYVIKP
ncbi:MAG: hypothetical protein AB1705_21525 [Verrucomicrobiota bacterium]